MKIHWHQLNLSHVLIPLLALGPVGSAAFAQVSEERASSRALEEIVVTAQKREQRLQDVPLSLSAITSQTLEDSGLSGIQDLAQMTPGLIFQETIGRQTTAPSIRGIAPGGFSDPTVAVMIDGYTSGFQRSGNNASLVELERVEILRGPQATLYGRNAIGGVINYITKKPDEEFRGDLRAEAGSYDTYLLQGSVSGPLMEDKLFGGIALGYRESGGFLDNEFTGESNVNDEEDVNARVSLRFVPTDRLEVNFTADYNEADDAYGDPSYVYPNQYLTGSPPSLLDVGAGLVDFNDIDRRVDQVPAGQGFVREEATFVLNVTYDLGWATLTSITGTSDQETSIISPFTREPSSAFDFDVQWDIESWSEELRLASQGDGPLQWMVGAYIFDNQRERSLFLDFGDANWALFQQSIDEVENLAVFGNVDYAISEKWSIAAGLRYDQEDRKLTDLLLNREGESSIEEWLPSLSLSYRPSDDIHVYGTVSRGYHAGGPNELGSVAAGAPESYDPEYLTNYEVGIKGQLPDAAFSYEVALFFMDWEEQQVFTAFDTFNRFIINAGQSEVYGIELFGRWNPVEGLELTGALSWLDTEYTEFFNPIDTAPFGIDPDLAGNRLPYAADLSASASAQYTRPLSNGWDLRLRADMSYVGDRAFDATNLFVADEYFTTNLYAGIQNERFELGAYARNVTDEEFLNGGFVPSPGFPPLATLGDPRIVGLRLRVRL
ncbi:TonB-dependent receptor [Luminiphilus syltensis]|nr:TonB-dependent receptor [Luminiphilus syltensis]